MIIYDVLVVIYLVVAVLLVGLVLIQQGKGADMGASFGSGGANTVFGASGSGNFLTRSTTVLASLFFVISLILGGMSNTTKDASDEWQNIEVPTAVEAKPEIKDIPVVDDEPATEIPD